MNRKQKSPSTGLEGVQTPRPRWQYIAALSVLATVPGIQGCGHAHNPQHYSEQDAPSIVIVATDTSSSVRETLPVRTEEVASFALYLDGRSSRILVFRFDSEVQEIMSAPMPGSDELLLIELAPKLATRSGRDNTYLDQMFTVLAGRAKALKGRCVIVVSTDWYCEGVTKEGHDSIMASAKELAENDHIVAVYVEGVAPANMAQMRRDLGPLQRKLESVDNGKLDVQAIAKIASESGENR